MWRAQQLTLFVASGGGAGYVPYCPGTCGTLVALPLSLSLNVLATKSFFLALTLLALLTAGAVWLAGEAARIAGHKDPRTVVVDEIAGFALANFLTASPFGVLAAFALFRFFDIAKVSPARRLESLPGGAGIVLDDVLAGFYTFVIVRLFVTAGML